MAWLFEGAGGSSRGNRRLLAAAGSAFFPTASGVAWSAAPSSGVSTESEASAGAASSPAAGAWSSARAAEGVAGRSAKVRWEKPQFPDGFVVPSKGGPFHRLGRAGERCRHAPGFARQEDRLAHARVLGLLAANQKQGAAAAFGKSSASSGPEPALRRTPAMTHQ